MLKRLTRAPAAAAIVSNGVHARTFHVASILHAPQAQGRGVNQSVVAGPAFLLALEDAAKRGDTNDLLRFGTALTLARVKPTVPIMNTVIGAFAAKNDFPNTFKYFYSMRELRLEPTADTFNHIIRMWAKFGDTKNTIVWLKAMRRNQTIPTRETVRACRLSFMIRAKFHTPFDYLKDAKLMKRFLALTPDVIAAVKTTHHANVLALKQRRATWLLQAEAHKAGKSIDSVKFGVESGDGGADGSGADAGVTTTAKAAKKQAAANKKLKAEAQAAAEAAERAALAAVKSNPYWDRVIRGVESLSPHGHAVLGIPDEVDSKQNLARHKKMKAKKKNPESYEDAAARAFTEMTRPLSIRGLMG